MSKDLNLITFLYVSDDKFEIFLFDKKNLKNLYKKQLKIQNNFRNIDFINLSKFLDENVYKIEKFIGKFIENIFLIIKSDINLTTNICIKRKIYNNIISKENLTNTLIDAKDLFKESYQKQTILHMIIDKYLIDGVNYTSFKTGVKSDYLSLEIKFLSLPTEYIFKFVKTFENYQIRVARTLCGNYLNDFSDNKNVEFSNIANSIINGDNKNEVLLIPKNVENKGFFEKFFQIFS